MIYAKKESDVKNLGQVFYCEAPFDKALKAITSKGCRIITASELAFARMQNDKDNSLSTNGSYLKEGILYVPNAEHKRILLRTSLILQDPSKATQAHSKSQEYGLGINFAVNEFLEKLPKEDFLNLENTYSAPTERFGEDARMIWLFGKNAKDYGLFMKDAGISKTGFYTDGYAHIKAQGQPYANQLWLRRLGSGSDIDGNNRDLSGGNWVRGVLVNAGEARASKKSHIETYTPNQMQSIVKKALHKEGIRGDLEKRIILNLRK